jgi:hypothetical protein
MASQKPDVSSWQRFLQILDKGVVVDAWARVSLVGSRILSVEGGS